ncbi:hypothetical protein Taro_008358 [Colocasia esculenta]|uniref:Uncharacterized protein n=1 Tax=Colocasia esculenta TaxID=4460 RepID=A0A843U0W5_COLES|nr:hypothetical protein [Colocasia esculenta]
MRTVLSAAAVPSPTVQKGSSRRCAKGSYSAAPTLSRTNPLPCNWIGLIYIYELANSIKLVKILVKGSSSRVFKRAEFEQHTTRLDSARLHPYLSPTKAASATEEGLCGSHLGGRTLARSIIRAGLVWRQGSQGGGGEQHEQQQRQRPRAGVEPAAAAQQAIGRQRRGSQAAATAAARVATSGEGPAAAAGASPSRLFSPPLLPPAAGKPGRRRRLGKEQGVPAVVTPSRGDAGSNKGGQRRLPQVVGDGVPVTIIS